MLQHLTYLHSGRRNHLLICDDFKASSTIKSLPPELLVGYFEAPALMDAAGDEARKFSVGYSTVRAVENLEAASSKTDKKRCWQAGWEVPLPASDRTLSVVFVGQSDSRPRYKHRELLRQGILNNHSAVPADVHIAIVPWGNETGRIPCREAMELLRSSRFVLTLPGDTATTDRIFNAFETLTLVAALSHERDKLLSVLPFHSTVPWASLIVWIDTQHFTADPCEAIVAATARMPMSDVAERMELMAQFRNEVLWLPTGKASSRAASNVLDAAYRRVAYLTES
jgi:hypothetical protein